MTDFAQVLFRGGQATPLLLARWRAKGAHSALQAGVTLTDKGRPTQLFRAAWSSAFPDRPALPDEVLHDAGGRMTAAFHRVFH